MIVDVIDFIWVYLMSMFKFVGGPVLGAALGLKSWQTAIMTFSGMMTTVFIISYFGLKLREYYLSKRKKKGKKFTRQNRRFIQIWRSYGEFGVSFLTPVLFSPIVGTLMVTLLSNNRRKVITYMMISASFWAIALSFAFPLLKPLFQKIF
ncbi:MAG TPA: hypothetical protein DDY13_00485 [Cytophagales bacterium]|jgi:hypothetical protein|nr:hypothetical protein [Cytophagales bacterium]